MTIALWILAAIVYLVVACVVYATLCYLDGAHGLEVSPLGNAAPSIVWPATLALFALFAACGLVVRVVSMLVVDPMRRAGERARTAGEAARQRGGR